jgi:hypothetical protein
MRKYLFPLLILLSLIAISGATVRVPVLVISDARKSQILMVRHINRNDAFATKFIHSVEHCPVWEYYRIDERLRIVLHETTFSSSNVGLPYAAFGEERFSTEADVLRISNMHRVIPELILWVDEKYDNTLKLGHENIKLFALAGNTLLRMSIEKKSLFEWLRTATGGKNGVD